jgi:hypothetical protein
VSDDNSIGQKQFLKNLDMQRLARDSLLLGTREVLLAQLFSSVMQHCFTSTVRQAACNYTVIASISPFKGVCSLSCPSVAAEYKHINKQQISFGRYHGAKCIEQCLGLNYVLGSRAVRARRV